MDNIQKSIDYLKKIEIVKPSDQIIRQIRDLISTKVLKPGDRLPSERALSERFSTGRGHVREALRKLEFYGILKTFPQSGTVVSSLGVKALEGLIAHVLNLHDDDFFSLMEARAILETQAAHLAAQRATDEDVRELEQSHIEFRRKVEEDDPGLEEDLLFHVKVAESCKNSVIRSLITLLTPDILIQSQRHKTCDDGSYYGALEDHEKVLNAIKAHDPERAAKAMEKHMEIWQKKGFGE